MKKEIVTVKYSLLAKIIYSIILLGLLGSVMWGFVDVLNIIDNDFSLLLLTTLLVSLFVLSIANGFYEVWFVGEHKAVIYKEEGSNNNPKTGG